MRKSKFMRKVIASVLVGTMALTCLTGCGSTSGDAGESTDSAEDDADGNGYADKLYLYNWSEYMTQEVKDGFYEEYGIEVVETTYESNEELFAKLTAGDPTDYDVIVPTNFFVGALIESDLLEPFDEGAITTFENYGESYLDQQYDPGNKYTIPYLGTASLVVGNKKMLDELGVTIDDWDDLADPKLENNLVVMDDNSGYTSLAYSCMGLDAENKTVEGLDDAQEYLIDKISPNVKAWCTNAAGRDMLVKNEAAVGYVYSGVAAQILAENPDTQLYLVDKKNSLSMDVWAMVKGTKHKKEAQLFINYVTSTEVAAKLVDYSMYVCPNTAAQEYVDDSIKENPACFLPNEFFENYYIMNEIPSDIAAKNDEVATVVKSSK